MFTSEIEFENHIRRIIKEKIIAISDHLILLENKDVVDIIICNDSESPKLFFIEVKFHKKTNVRIGFGDENGRGFQPEILKRKPRYFDNNMLWIFGQEHDPKYYVLNSNRVSEYIAGGSITEQHQNNFQRRLFQSETGLDENEFINNIKSWFE
jgi:hypothetical protein